MLSLRDRRPFYTPRDVAEIARVDPKTVLSWIHEDKLSAIRLSERIYRIPLSAVVKLLSPSDIRRRTVRRTGRIPSPGYRDRRTSRQAAARA